MREQKMEQWRALQGWEMEQTAARSAGLHERGM